MAAVFVSFATEDLSVAREVVGWLRDDGHDVFLDRDAESGIRAGEQWRQRLYDELRRVDAVISIVTPDSAGSAWCTAELGIADALGCLLIPLVAVDGARHPLLGHRQHVDYHADPPAARTRVLDALQHLDGGSTTRRWRDGANPFPGLAPFSPASAAVYFGRSVEIRELANRLRAARSRPGQILVVVGPSGCGKSSLLGAGLLPLLAHDAEWVTTPPWTPGDEPLSGLTRSLTHAAQRSGLPWSPQQIRDALADGPRGLRRVATDLLGARPTAHDQRLLVAVDQGEELFTRTGPAERAHVAALLRDAARGPAQPVLTLRSEFLDDLRDLPELGGVPIDALVLPPLGRDMLAAVIEGPARVAGLRLEPELLPRLVHDTGGGDALPLLAFTLQQLSDGLGRGDTLTLARYGDLGGVRGALVRHADAALAAVVAATGHAEHEVLAGLVRLVTIDDAGRWARRRVAVAGLPESVRAAIAILVDRRLLVVDSADGADTVAVAHESLLTAWPPLHRAIDERLAALQAARTVEQAAADWQRDGRPDHYLWDEKRLTGASAHLGARDAADGPAVHLEPDGQAFLDASRRRVGVVQRQAQRRRRRLVTVLSVLLVLALVAAGTAALQWSKVRQAQRLTAARALLTQADLARERDPRGALQLAAAAYGLDRGAAADANIVETLWGAPALRATFTEPGSRLWAALVSTDGQTLLTAAADDGTVQLWNLTDRERPRRTGFPFPGDEAIRTFAATPDLRTLAAVGQDGRPILWDLTDPEHPRAAAPPLDLGGTAVADLVFSPDARTLVATADDATLRLWDVTDPGRPRSLGEPLRDTAPTPATATRVLHSTTFSGDGRRLVAARSDQAGGVLVGADIAVVWDVTDRERPRELTRTPAGDGSRSFILALAVDRDGRTVAVVGRSVELWDIGDPAAPQRLAVPPSLEDDAGALLAFGPDGRTLAVATTNVELWDVVPDGLRPRGRPLVGHTDRVSRLTSTADGRTLVTASDDGTAILWDLTMADPTAPRTAPPTAVAGAVFSPAANLLAGIDADGRVQLYDPADPRGPRPIGPPLTGPGRATSLLAFSADGRTLAGGHDDNTVTLWDVVDPDRPRTAPAPITVAAPTPPDVLSSESLTALAFSPDGTTVATAQGEGVTLWDVTDLAAPRRRGVSFGIEGGVTVGGGIGGGLSFSPDGARLAIDVPDGLGVWDVTDPDRPRPLATLPDAGSPLFLPDGMTLVTLVGRAVVLWNLSDPAEPRALGRPIAGPTDVLAVAPDGRTLATGSFDGAPVELWDLTDQERPRRLGAPGADAFGLTSGAFTPDGRTLALRTTDGLVLYDLSRLADLRRDPLGQACARAGSLPPEVWDVYAPGLDYVDPCAR